ncbi:hypothetical protein [Iodobacter fluviatilis]|uniref:PD(D/E)XK endonuclease domain-containing protein n=1 Tax=Iodobacter fluviatilis TaxID=537 RepID=A0A377Q7Z2_9NEIS|nr:hypothetical protein [Iodobacter fluviatilis]TCU89468.1 hypothetical protein EV682_102380 [Iodobacter fluviatilis]STQ90838.1 Uncharacterised protein [Iodobacter fluviatilis]
MKHIGSFGEYVTLSELLRRDIEAYPAILKNQEDYDITVIVSASKVVRLQVKTTELQNNSTNNSVKGTDKNYDFLVLVVIDNENVKFYVIPKKKVDDIRFNSVDLSVSRKNGSSYCVKNCFNDFENKWDLIK